MITGEDKEKLEKIIESIEGYITESNVNWSLKELKALIEPEKWEPKKYQQPFYIGGIGGEFDKFDGDRETETCKERREYGNEWETRELATIARDMNKRNQLILQAKHEIGAEDGNHEIIYGLGINQWFIANANRLSNPELGIDTHTNAVKILEMLQLNANPS